MKYASILILTILVSSCCGTKKSIENQTSQTNKITVITKTPDVVEPSKEIETPREVIPKMPLPHKPPKLDKTEVTNDSYSEAFNHARWNKLLQKNVTDTGKVDYKAFKNDSSELIVYIDDLTHNTPNSDWSKNEKLAYWINAYNALTIDLIIRNYPTKSIKDIKNPWDQRLWQFGKKWYNLNDIEHKILRKMDEPRIHFAIVCASVSCPKLSNEAYTSENLEHRLTKATKDFLSDSTRNNISTNSIEVSKIFQWFAKDFKKNGNLIDFLNRYSNIQISAKAKINYKGYNWDLNE
ncbi:DUF547 domain-containing protein [Mariniflexile soesokkakense]|uniref:DUF547 domain-containing protein n=1 Tax=Mariniflexile soesokkakense TaxID=1343160 RepID=A0ABV0A7J5_9FLAO